MTKSAYQNYTRAIRAAGGKPLSYETLIKNEKQRDETKSISRYAQPIRR